MILSLSFSLLHLRLVLILVDNRIKHGVSLTLQQHIFYRNHLKLRKPCMMEILFLYQIYHCN